jgi:hypothetical protein
MGGRAAATLALALVAAGVLSACESTQDKSARLERDGAGKADVSAVARGARNADVQVLRTTVLADAKGGRAIVVALRDTGPSQAAVPLQIVAKDAKGAPVYKNDLEGLQTSLQQMAFLARGRTAYWVHDQVIAPAKPASVDVHVAASKAPRPRSVPDVRLRGVHLTHDDSGLLVKGVVQNRSAVPQRNMPIYAVATKGGRVVAAGRALIERLDPEPQKKPTVFRIYFIGDPSGAALDVRAIPSTFPGASS